MDGKRVKLINNKKKKLASFQNHKSKKFMLEKPKFANAIFSQILISETTRVSM